MVSENASAQLQKMVQMRGPAREVLKEFTTFLTLVAGKTTDDQPKDKPVDSARRTAIEAMGKGADPEKTKQDYIKRTGMKW